MTQYLGEIIGQESVKTRLAIYKDSYSQTGVLPFILLVGQRGQGKSRFVREFRKTLVKPDGSKPKLIEINCASIKSVSSFFDQIYPLWAEGNTLFFDEIHALPDKLQNLFLTILEKDKNPIRKLTIDIGNGAEEFVFDFTEMSFIGATTNHEKLSGPLNDRLTQISLSQYTKEDLFKILKMNTDVDICGRVESLIKDVFRGHPRHCVEIAENLEKYAIAKSIDKVEESHWHEFCKIMGIFEHGFTEAEIQIVKALGEKGGEASLESLSASTGYSKTVIQKQYEHALLKRGIIEIGPRRQLSRVGFEFYRKIKDKV